MKSYSLSCHEVVDARSDTAPRVSYAQVTVASSLQKELNQSTSNFGVSECDSGTSRYQHTMSDVGVVTTELDESIQGHSVIECRHLGKYKSDSNSPPPILVKMARQVDVMSVLTHLSGSISIKPDLTRQERSIEKLLLKGRWSLINAGTSRKDIRISSLFVKGQGHARVINRWFL